MLTATRLQRTIARDTEVHGIGFIHGSDVGLRFLPAAADTGIVFVRTDLPSKPTVRAHISNVVPRQRRTAIQNGPAVVEMVEHVMAALSGLRIDNCVIEINAPETPGCDGSSREFVDVLGAAGAIELDRPREVLLIDKPITVREGEAILTAHPGHESRLMLGYHLDYGRQTPIGSQSLFLEITPENFIDELASSRTFLLEAEAKALRDSGIGSRTNEGDLLIFGPEGVIGNTLRYPDECVRHKMLDLVGDLALLGKDLVGHVVAHRSGHLLNATLVRALIAAAAGERPAKRRESVAPAMDADAIARILPHRFPFLLIDRVLVIEPGKRLTAIKNVSINEPFFQEHWPGRPIMPGVLILEALAQAAGLMIADFVDSARKVTMIAAIDDARLRKPVVPGDQLKLEVNCLRLKSSIALVKGVATVDGLVAAEATFKFVMVDLDKSAA